MTSKQASHSDVKFTTYAQWHGRRQKCIWPEISIWEYCITFEFSNHIYSQKSGKLHSCGRWCKRSLRRVILVLKQIRRRRQRDVKKGLDWKSNTFAETERQYKADIRNWDCTHIKLQWSSSKHFPSMAASWLIRLIFLAVNVLSANLLVISNSDFCASVFEW